MVAIMSLGHDFSQIIWSICTVNWSHTTFGLFWLHNITFGYLLTCHLILLPRLLISYLEFSRSSWPVFLIENMFGINFKDPPVLHYFDNLRLDFNSCQVQLLTCIVYWVSQVALYVQLLPSSFIKLQKFVKSQVNQVQA